MSVFVLCLLANVLLLSIVFLIARRMKRFDLVDAAWGWAIIVPTFISYALQRDTVDEWDIQTIVTFLVLLWGLRLSGHIWQRIQRTDAEDPRYVELRKKWRGNITVNIFFRIYIVQAVLALIVAMPAVLINMSPDPAWSVWAVVGLITWAIGFSIEMTADNQLRRFVTNPHNRGKIMMSGLWRYSRHPNYFGELTQWWGIGIICLGVPFGWIGLLGPLMISYLILFVSGIPPSEKRFDGRPGWADYKRQTSVLIPLPKKE